MDEKIIVKDRLSALNAREMREFGRALREMREFGRTLREARGFGRILANMKRTRTMCDWAKHCPRENDRLISCKNCPAVDRPKRITHSKAVKEWSKS